MLTVRAGLGRLPILVRLGRQLVVPDRLGQAALVQLHYAVPSSSSRRVLIVMALKGVTCEGVRVDLRDADSVAAHAEENPMAQVPVLVVDGPDASRRISQSVAIAEYLDERFPDPPLLGRGAGERAHVRQLVELVNSGIQPLHNMKTIAEVRRLGGDAAVAAWLDRFIHRGLAALERHASAASGRYVTGADVTLADVFVVPQLEFARRFAELAPGRYPALEVAEAACLEIEAFSNPPLPPPHPA